MKFPRIFLALALSMTAGAILAVTVDTHSTIAFAEESGLPDDIMDSSAPADATPAPAKAAKKTDAKKAEDVSAEKKSDTKPTEKVADKPAKKLTPPQVKDPKVKALAESMTDSKAAKVSAAMKSDESVKPIKGENTTAAAASAELKVLKTIDQRYQSAKSVAMDLDKTLVLGLLGKEKKSKGHLLLSKGKMRLEISAPEKSIVVIDGKTLWVADYPSEDLKGAPVQVMKGALDSKKGADQAFVSLLTRGGVLKHFKVSGVQKDDKGRNLYFLQPIKQSSDFKRAQLTLSADGKEISELRYWDDRDNETRLMFSNVKFDAPVPAKTFEFTPPENADISTI